MTLATSNDNFGRSLTDIEHNQLERWEIAAELLREQLSR